MCFPDEASRQDFGVCIMGALLIDLVVFAYMAFVAITQRGTITGWLATIAVVGYTVYTLVMLRRKS